MATYLTAILLRFLHSKAYAPEIPPPETETSLPHREALAQQLTDENVRPFNDDEEFLQACVTRWALIHSKGSCEESYLTTRLSETPFLPRLEVVAQQYNMTPTEQCFIANCYAKQRTTAGISVFQFDEKTDCNLSCLVSTGACHYRGNTLDFVLDTVLTRYLDGILPHNYFAKPNFNSMMTVILPDETKEKILAAVSPFIQSRNPRGMVLLFSGPTGTGKTYAARAVAAYLKCKCVVVQTNPPDITEAYAEAVERRGMVLIDGCSFLFERPQNAQYIEELESTLDSFVGLTIMTTHSSHLLPVSLKRRVNLSLEFSSPDEVRRKSLWTVLLPTEHQPDVDISRLASDYEINGGQIKNAITLGLSQANYRQLDATEHGSPALQGANTASSISSKASTSTVVPTNQNPKSTPLAVQPVHPHSSPSTPTSNPSPTLTRHSDSDPRPSSSSRSPSPTRQHQAPTPSVSSTTSPPSPNHGHSKPPNQQLGLSQEAASSTPTNIPHSSPKGSTSCQPLGPSMSHNQHGPKASPTLNPNFHSLPSSTRQAKGQHPAHQPSSHQQLSMEDLVIGCKAQTTEVTTKCSKDLYRAVTPKCGLSKVLATATVKTQLEEIVLAVQAREVLANEWGFMEGHHENNQGIGVMFSGPPGTGKTMAAKAIAMEVGQTLKIVNSAQLRSKFVGETSKNIEAVFEDSTNQAAVLLFDEAEGLFAERTNSHGSTHTNDDIGNLLCNLEQYPGIVIFITNCPDFIDRAFLRRIKFNVKFELPTKDIREDLWRQHVPQKCPLDADINWPKLAEGELSGGDIKAAVFRAACRAAVRKGEQHKLTMGDLEHALGEQLRERDTGHTQHGFSQRQCVPSQ